jgi:pimeloyl-ACP methyl ester carboxylesterase
MSPNSNNNTITGTTNGAVTGSAAAIQKLILNPKYTKKKVYFPSDGNGDSTRVLSYSECGNIESGMPVIFCFGLMTSSIAIMFAHHRALRNNLRIIAIDYPGIGESTYVDDRTLAEWGDDVMYFCDTVLGVDSKVRLLGHSLGGLHVLALLSHSKFKKRVVRSVLLCPWLYIDGEEFNPMWIRLTHGLPTIFKSKFIPYVLTGLSSSTINLATWSQPEQLNVQAAKLVTDYCFLQGQQGSQQMVQFALSKCDTYLPHDLFDSPVLVYHGKQDQLVLESSTMELVRLLNQRKCNAKHISLDDCDHNSLLSNVDNLIHIMSNLVGDDDTWASEIINSLSRIGDHNYQNQANRSRSMPNGSRQQQFGSIKLEDEEENHERIVKSQSNHR